MNRLHFFKHFFIFSVMLLLVGVTACEDDFLSASDQGDMVLQFSVDTLTFDTVFSTIGSATSKILVYNTHNQAVSIDEVRLVGGVSSAFRMNVDGAVNTAHTFSDVVIRAKDSLYIFVEVAVDPTGVHTPVLIQDSIVFSMQQTKQRVLLEAFGQDMELLKEVHISADTTLSVGKPYLIYGYLTVDSASTLTLPAGCQLYFHNNADLLVHGNLHAEGTHENPVLMRGDRLDNINFVTPVPYKYVSGQWGGVYLLSKKGKHVLRHVDMSSGYVGLYFYNEDRNFRPSLEIHNCRIHNFLLYNLVAVNGDLLVTNTEISNSGGYTVYLNGGKHAFYHATIVNYFGLSPVQPINRDNDAAVMLMDLNRSLPMETIFANCVISGTAQHELTLATKYPSHYNGNIHHTYIKKSDPLDLPIFSDVIWSNQNDTVFQHIRFDYEAGLYFDFTPDSVSPIRGLADPDIAAEFPLDLKGNNRLTDGNPDAGAYEWHPTPIAE